MDRDTVPAGESTRVDTKHGDENVAFIRAARDFYDEGPDGFRPGYAQYGDLLAAAEVLVNTPATESAGDTPRSAPAEVEVTQADREAAADLIEQYWRDDSSASRSMRRLAQSYRDGHTQGVWATAFARHRASSKSAEQSEVSRLREALKKADAAINAAFMQADAEARGHDRRADQFDRIVREGRTAVRAALNGGAS